MGLKDNLNQAKTELENQTKSETPSSTQEPAQKAKDPKGGQSRKRDKSQERPNKPQEFRPVLDSKGGVLRLSFKNMVQGHAFTSAHDILDSKATEYLMPLIKPLVKLINAAVNRQLKVLESSGFQHTLDAEGRPTKDRAVDAEGKFIKLPSAIDIAKGAYAKMLSDPEIIKFLGLINNRLKALDGSDQAKEEKDEPPTTGPVA